MGLPAYILPIMGKGQSFVNLYSTTFDGLNERITVADNDVFSFTSGGVDQPFSFTGWVKTTLVDGNIRIVFSKYNGSTTIAEYFMFLFSGGIRFHLLGSGSAFIRIGRNTNNSIMSINTWYFIAGTYSGSEVSSGVKIYLGTTVSAATQVDTADSVAGVYTGMSNTAVKLNFGGDDNGGFLLSGKIYHPAMWNKELSAAEVEEIRVIQGGDLRSASCEANLIEPYYFPTGTGDYPTLTGYKNGYNGTMINQESADINTDVPT